MNSQSYAEKLYAGILGLAGWVALVLQCSWAVQTGLSNGLSMAMALTNVLSYFTILTNLLVASYSVLTAAGKRIGTAGARTALASYILIVGVVYEVALRRLWNPQGWHLFVDIVLHYVAPLGYLTYWLLFVPKASLRYRLLPRWTLYPLAYLIYSLVRGHFYGFFPYPFIDYPQIGWPRLYLNVVVLIVVFVLTGALLIWIGRVQSRISVERGQ